MVDNSTTCDEYISMLDDKTNCTVDVLFGFTLVNYGSACITVTNITLTEDSNNTRNIFLDVEERRLCPEGNILVTETKAVDMCSYAGRDIQYDLVIKGENSEVIITNTSLPLVDLELPLSIPSSDLSLTPSLRSSSVPSMSPILSPPSPSPLPLERNKNKCNHPTSKLWFIYQQKSCNKRSRHRNKSKGGKGSFGGEKNFSCEDHTDVLDDHVKIIVSSTSDGEILFEGQVSKGEKFDIHSQNGRLKSNMRVMVYAIDGHLVQNFIVNSCSKKRLQSGDTFGSITISKVPK